MGGFAHRWNVGFGLDEAHCWVWVTRVCCSAVCHNMVIFKCFVCVVVLWVVV